MKSGSFIVTSIIVQRQQDKHIFRLVEQPSLRHVLLCPALWQQTDAQVLLHMHAINNSSVLSFCKKIYSQNIYFFLKSTSTYGACFCISGLMFLSSLFVLRIIVLKTKWASVHTLQTGTPQLLLSAPRRWKLLTDKRWVREQNESILLFFNLKTILGYLMRVPPGLTLKGESGICLIPFYFIFL